MRIGFLSTLAVVPAVLSTALATVASASQDRQPAKQEQKKGTGAEMTGCVDEKEGHYVLVDDRELKPIAGLEPDGFPVEGFAKYVGHKVTVRGTKIAGGAQPRMKVRTIETISQTCTPQSP